MKKKFLFTLLILTLLPLLASCTYIDSLRKMANKTTYPNKAITVNYYLDDNELYKSETTEKRKNFTYPENPTKDSYNFGGWTYKDSYQTLDPEDFLYDETDTIDLYAYFSKGIHFSDNLGYNGPYFVEGSLPSLGSPKVLVVPVDLGGNTTNQMIDSINETFNGTAASTGYESVKSFYEKSSNGRLNLSFDIFNGWFKPEKDLSYYEDYDATKDEYYESGAGKILHEFLTKYDSVYDFSDYDYDKDGYIDSVWMIYNVEPNYETTDFYWAYVTFSQNSKKIYDNTKARYYGFASYYFIFEKNLETKYHKKLELYDMSDITYDAHTYIHETGHLLGLDDYYDSDATQGGSGGLYAAGMMDANQGDFNSIDKLLLGWIDPYVIYYNSEKTITINSFSSSNDVILLSKVNPTSIYTEYFLIDLYNSEGLGSRDVPIVEPSSSCKMKALVKNIGYQNYGIRILHINATMTNTYNGKTYSFPVAFQYNNSTTRKLFVDTVMNNPSFATQKNSDVRTGVTELNYYSLYSSTGTYNISNNYKMTNGTNAFFNFSISQISSQSATLSFDFI